MTPRTRYLLYIDESGGHDLGHVDPKYPVFVLVGLLVGEKYYQQTLVPRVKALKKENGFDRGVVLHSNSIRRHRGDFRELSDPVRREALYESLNAVFETSRMRLHAVVIDKRRFVGRFVFPPNPYDVSLSQLLSLVCGPPRIVGANRPQVVKIIAESRGRAEDKLLQAEFQRFRQAGLRTYGADGVQSRRSATVERLFPQRIDFVKKTNVVTGLELADLAAYPIGRAHVNGDWTNPACVAVASRLRAFVAFP